MVRVLPNDFPNKRCSESRGVDALFVLVTSGNGESRKLPASLLGPRAKSHIFDQPTYGQVVGLVQRYPVRADLSGIIDVLRGLLEARRREHRQRRSSIAVGSVPCESGGIIRQPVGIKLGGNLVNMQEVVTIKTVAAWVGVGDFVLRRSLDGRGTRKRRSHQANPVVCRGLGRQCPGVRGFNLAAPFPGVKPILTPVFSCSEHTISLAGINLSSFFTVRENAASLFSLGGRD